MRIDFTQATHTDLGNIAAQADSVQHKAVTVQNVPHVTAVEKTEPTAKTKSSVPQPDQVNVSVDDRQNVIYRFTNPNNGEVVRQVPPEEILRIMRNIEDLLHESEQKLKIAL